MAFVEREDVLNAFEGLAKHLFKSVLCDYLGHANHPRFNQPFPRMSYADALRYYGTDKPDIRFEMKICDLTLMAKGHGFSVFDSANYIGGICAKGAGEYTRKQLDELTEWVKRPQIGAKGLVYARVTPDGIKSSVDKFYIPEVLQNWADAMEAGEGDLILILCGTEQKTQAALGALRLEMGNLLGLRRKEEFAPLWVYDFPLLEWDEETQRFYAMHHPFTSPKPEDLDKFYSNKKEDLEQVCANAYDFVLNGVEIGGGSIRIHDAEVQKRMFEVLGFSQTDADYRFGFIINAFKYGAPPHGGIAFGFDRWCAIFGGAESIRDYIAFPKNNSGRDMMLDAPSYIDDAQMKELALVSTAEKR
jgi:aspartyl-tRNA synthetase